MRKLSIAIALASAALAPLTAFAQEDTTDPESEQSVPERPTASIADMTWLEGEWRGTGIGGNPAGESFSFAGDGQMIGHFWQLDDAGGVDFYELITVTPDGDSLTMRLKHFTADLTGWEAQEGIAALEFPLKARSDTRWVFGPVTFTTPEPDALEVSVTVRNKDGSLGSFDFSYRRVSSG